MVQRIDNDLQLLKNKRHVLETADTRIDAGKWEDIIDEISHFREDISSTEVRENTVKNLINQL